MLVREVVTDARTGEAAERMVDMPGILTWEQAEAADLVRRSDEVRAERSRRLSWCDWTTKADVPMSEGARAAWLAYRQALRDIPEQGGFPDSIQWPTAP